MHHFIHRMTILVCCILAFGTEGEANQVRDNLRRGAQLEQQGQFFRAATTYLVVLRLEPGNGNGRAALTRTIDQATAEKLAAAAALEAELRIDEAIAEIEAAGRLVERAAFFNIEGGQTSVVESRRLDLVNRRVQALLLDAELAREEGLWSAALAILQQVETLSPGFGETREMMRDVWLAWADTNEREGRLRAAAERLGEAARIPGERSGVASARAAAIHSGLGLSDLRNGACRSAVAELRAAARLAPGSTDPAALEQADACARTCAQLRVTADPESGLGENQLGLLNAEVRRQVASGASEFLLLRDSGGRSSLNCDRRLVPGIDGQPMNVGPYSTSVRITALSVIRQPASSSTGQARSHHGAQVETVVTYQQYVEVLSGTLSGWVTVTDHRSGGASIQLPVTVTDEALSRWRDNTVSSSATRTGPTGRSSTSTGVMVGGSGGGRAEADEARRQARAHLNERLVHSFAAEAARLMLSVVDAEPAAPDPTELPDAEVQ